METNSKCVTLRMDGEGGEGQIYYNYLKTGVTIPVSPYLGEPFLYIMYVYLSLGPKAILLP